MSKPAQQINQIATKNENGQLPQPPIIDPTSPLAPIPVPLPETIHANEIPVAAAKRGRKEVDTSPKNITTTPPTAIETSSTSLIQPTNNNIIPLPLQQQQQQQQQQQPGVTTVGIVVSNNGIITTTTAGPSVTNPSVVPTGTVVITTSTTPTSSSSPTSLSKKYSLGGGKWTQEEDEKLKEGVQSIGPKNWKRISQEFLGGHRSDIQCLHRWQKVLKPGLVKGRWSKEEDAIIIECIKNGMTKWSRIASYIPGRIGKQCRDRWYNQLHPQLVRADWTEEEDRILQDGHNQYGNKWTEIAKLLPGRSDNCVKNRWNSAIRKNKRKSMKQLERESNTPILSNLNTSQIANNVSISNPNLISQSNSSNGVTANSSSTTIQTPIPMVMEQQSQQNVTNQQSSQQTVTSLKDDKQIDEVSTVRANPYTGEQERTTKRAKIAQI